MVMSRRLDSLLKSTAVTSHGGTIPRARPKRASGCIYVQDLLVMGWCPIIPQPIQFVEEPNFVVGIGSRLKVCIQSLPDLQTGSAHTVKQLAVVGPIDIRH